MSYFWAMRDRFLDYIKKHALISTTDKVLLAVSGGVDSMVLMHLCQEANINFGVAHCNFGLRGEASDADEALVKKSCAELKVPVFVRSFDTKGYAAAEGVSTQMAARDLRYAWFQDLLTAEGYTLIASAHHLDDSFETVIHNLVRGTAISGLRGIKLKNGKVIRPLIDFKKSEIEAWAVDQKIVWREDASNQETYYKRNFIRQKVSPLLREMNPDLLNTFRDTAARNAEVEDYFLAQMEQLRLKALKKEGDTVCLNKTDVSGPYILSQLLKPFGFNYSQSKEMVTAFSEHSGRQFVSRTHRLTVDREMLLIDDREEQEVAVFFIEADERGDVKVGTDWYTMSHTTEQPNKQLLKEQNAFLDMRKLTFPLKVRAWQEGDQFQPLGMRGKKKLSDFMIDRKIPVNLKKHVRVLESAGEIVWVAGLRIDDRFKVSDDTQTIFSLIQKMTDV